MKTLLTNCRVIKDAHSLPVRENILIDGQTIVGFPKEYRQQEVQIVDLNGRTVIPGFVQTHVHFCQVLFRGLADDLALLPWLRTKIWPLEASHNEASTYLSAMLGGIELLAGGVTTVCVMESVQHADAAARAIERLGIRAVFGKNMMDYTDTPEELGGMPASFIETTKQTIEESKKLLDRWHGKADGRISYAFMPRGILTTSEELLMELKSLSKEYGVLIHTHACETEPESVLVKNRRGNTEIKYLEHLGLARENLLLAHCVCVDEDDISILKEKRIKVASCPLTNLKLASGIAPLDRFLKENITFSFGSDGAPCNNNLSMFQEMRYASLLQKGILHNPEAMKADAVFHAATMGGARALGLENICGSLEIGKRADLAVLDFEQPSILPSPVSIATIVYAGNSSMVTDTMVDGKWVYRNKEFVNIDINLIADKAKKELSALLERFERRSV